MQSAAIARRTGWASQLPILEGVCKRVMLLTADCRHEASMLIRALDELTPEADDNLLAAELIREVRVHAEDLTLRLERPGEEAIHLRAAAARLCQTIAVLRRHAARSGPPSSESGDAAGEEGLCASQIAEASWRKPGAADEDGAMEKKAQS